MARAPSSRSAGKPASGGASPARDIALRVLSDLREGRLTARQAIDALIERHPAGPQDRALATELVIGVVVHRMTLARILNLFTTRGWQRVGQGLQHILMLGAYQLLYLDAIPQFAAVDEAVEQARREGGARTGHFANAVLRSLIRDIEHRRLPIEQADPRRAVLIDARQACQLRRAFLPDPLVNPIGFWSDATSHPAWMVARWCDAYGLDAAIRVCRAGICRPPVTVRPNRLRIDAPELRRRLASEGIKSDVLPGGTGLVLEAGAAFLRTRAFADGLFQPQDRTAMEVLHQTCTPWLRPEQVIVDMCSGLGTKATQFAELTHNRGLILATDRDPRKLELLRANARRLGCGSIQVVALDDLVSRVAAAGGAHGVLVDAPCSNTGVLARRPEARYRLTPRSLEKLSQLQSQVLAEAAQLLRPGGWLIYATCSIDPRENEQVTARFGESHSGWRFVGSSLTLPETGPLPTDWRDGGYWSLWQKP